MTADQLTYLNKIRLLTPPGVVEEIKDICKLLNVNPKKYLIFRDTGGLSYMLGKIAENCFFSMQPIDPDIRFKLSVLMTCSKATKSVCTIFELNRNLEDSTNTYWLRDRYTKELEEVKQKIKSTAESWAC